MWSHVFIHNEGEQKIAILLLDTRGVFKQTSSDNYESIFALSTLVSSVQIYNFWENVQENHLYPLKLFTEFERMTEESDSKPFQRLQFLVRDWVSNDTYDYGADGGVEMLDDYLESIANQLGIMKTDRELMSLCFPEIGCFLMPHPGFDFLLKSRFNEQLVSMKKEFKENLKTFVISLLSPSKLRVKVMNGQQISAGELVTYFKSYVEATSEARLILSEGKDIYVKEINKICKGSHLSESQFYEKDDQIRQDCLQWVSTYKITCR